LTDLVVRCKTTIKRRLKAAMPKQTKGDTRDLRFRIGVEYVDFLEQIAETNRFGNSVGDVARRILEDGMLDYLRRSLEFKSEHGLIKRKNSARK
jgi:hypothetical protein